jgi:hypothetical protein
MVRLAHDEPSTPLKYREGTISTPFRKIFAIICLSPVFLMQQHPNAGVNGYGEINPTFPVRHTFRLFSGRKIDKAQCFRGVKLQKSL